MRKLENWQILQRQSLPLPVKIKLSERRIIDWYDNYLGEVYVSFSGGKDSTVLLDLVRSIYPEVPAVFLDTGLEYPEVRDFVKTIDNVIWVKPKLTFKQVIEKYGYPVVSKEISNKVRWFRNTKSDEMRNKILYGSEKGHSKISNKWKYLIGSELLISDQCCTYLKKNPAKLYEKESGRHPYIGNMADDSRLRKMTYMENGCNGFDLKRPISNPIAFWKEEDIWGYINLKGIPYSKIYDMGYKNTGCVFCMFSLFKEVPNKFELMKITHPKLYSYCMDKLNLKVPLDLIGAKY